MARSRKLKAAPKRLLLDSGAVIGLSRGGARARAYLARALELGIPIEVPVAVVAETLRGRPDDAPVHRVLKAVDAIPATTERMGRTAGELLGRHASSATVDALVVAQAIEAGGAHILTGDREDLERLASRAPTVHIQPL